METNEMYRGRLIDHLQLVVKDINASKKFYTAVFEVLGIPLGGSGERPYHPGYYGAFVIDPDGNNIEAVYHGEGKKSADFVKITW